MRQSPATTLLSGVWPLNNRVALLDQYSLRHLIDHLLPGRRWMEIERVWTNLEFIEAKCLAGMAFDLLSDYSRALALKQVPTLIQMQRALALTQPTLSDCPKLTIQSVYNRLHWFDPLEPELRGRLEEVCTDLDKRRCWIRAEAPLPQSETLATPSIAFEIESAIQSMSVDGRTIAVATVNGGVEIRDLTDNGRLIGSKKELPTRITAIALNKDPDSLTFMGADGIIRSERYATCLVGRKGEKVLIGHPIHGILAVREDSALVLWQPEHDEAIVLARNLPVPLIVLRLSRDGQGVVFVAGYRAQTIGISVWDGRDWRTQLLSYAGLPVVDAYLDPEAGRILLATIDRRLSVLDLEQGKCLAQLSYERRADHPLRGAPVKCALGTGTSQGWAFIATDTGQLAAWNWHQDTMDRFEPYRSPYGSAVLVLMEVLPSSGALLITTNRQGKIIDRSSPQSDQRRQQKPISACWLTTGNKVVATSELDHTIQWFSVERLAPLGVQADRFPTALSQGGQPDTILVGNRAGKVWPLHLDADTTEESLLDLGEPVVSLFCRADGPAVVAAGRHGDVVCISLTRENYEKLWHTTGYQTRIKILPAGSHGLFWSLHYDEKLEQGKPVISLVRGVDQERVIMSGFDLKDLAVASDGAAICVSGRDVQVLRFDGSQWRCVFRREKFVERVCFLGEDNFLAVVLGRWLEVWQVAPGLRTVATIDLQPTQTQVTCLYATGNRIVAGCRSGDLMLLSLRGID